MEADNPSFETCDKHHHPGANQHTRTSDQIVTKIPPPSFTPTATIQTAFHIHAYPDLTFDHLDIKFQNT